jgi:hypothetical protein
MMEIEFLDPEDSPRSVEAANSEEIGREPSRWASFDVGALGPALLLIGAAALAVFAPFQQVYVLSQRHAEPPLVIATDGWGRMSIGSGGAAPPGFHEPRYGIPLCVAASVLVLLLLVLAAGSVGWARARRIRVFVTAAAVAATGVLAGVFAAMWLAVDARFSEYRSGIQTDAAGPNPLALGYGACVWLSGAAVAAAALGVGAAVRRQRVAAAG